VRDIEAILNSPSIQPSLATQNDINGDVRMVVIDEIVVGPNVCSFIFCY
jgi:hypothetical protein